MLKGKEIKEILGLFDQVQAIFIATELGVDILTDDDKAILKRVGINLEKLPPSISIEYAFQLGMLSQSLTQRELKTLTYNQLKKLIISGNFVPLSVAELGAIEATKFILYNEIKGLGNRVKGDISRTLIEADKKQRFRTEKTIQSKTKEAVLDRKSIGWLSSELGHATGDWSRDFDRIADYNMHYVFNNGIVYEMLKGGEKPEDVEVYFDVFESACPHCIDLYLTDGLGSEPRIFKLSEILANGTNIGRKTKDWRPVVPPTHPWCRCQINRKPANSIWDAAAKRWKIVRSKEAVKRKSKVKVTIEY